MPQRLDVRLADLTVLGTLAWRAARWITGDRFGPLAMINAWSDWLETAGLAAGGHSLFYRRHPLVGLALLTAAAVRAGQALQWRLPHDEPSAPTDLRIFTQNLLWHHRSGDAFAALLQREQPDVILLQELTPTIAAHIQAELGSDYPYRLLEPAEGSFGFGLLSRYPLLSLSPTPPCPPQIGGGEGGAGRSEILRWPSGSRYAQVATVTVGGRQVDLYNCHLIPPLGRSLRRLGATRVTRLREAQIRLLTERILTAGRPAVLAGDFNLTPSQHAYHLLTPALLDAWLEAGVGPGVTWPLNVLPLPWPTVPLLRLDYCFHTPDFVAHRAQVLYSTTGSDHCPLVVDLAFAGPPIDSTTNGDATLVGSRDPLRPPREPTAGGKGVLPNDSTLRRAKPQNPLQPSF